MRHHILDEKTVGAEAHIPIKRTRIERLRQLWSGFYVTDAEAEQICRRVREDIERLRAADLPSHVTLLCQADKECRDAERAQRG